MCGNHVAPDANGEIWLPGATSLDITLDPFGIKKYLVDTEFKDGRKVLCRTPSSVRGPILACMRMRTIRIY
jgi:hypothetical protein